MWQQRTANRSAGTNVHSASNMWKALWRLGKLITRLRAENFSVSLAAVSPAAFTNTHAQRAQQSFTQKRPLAKSKPGTETLPDAHAAGKAGTWRQRWTNNTASFQLACVLVPLAFVLSSQPSRQCQASLSQPASLTCLSALHANCQLAHVLLELAIVLPSFQERQFLNQLETIAPNLDCIPAFLHCQLPPCSCPPGAGFPSAQLRSTPGSKDPVAGPKHHGSEGRIGPAARSPDCQTLLSELTRN